MAGGRHGRPARPRRTASGCSPIWPASRATSRIRRGRGPSLLGVFGSAVQLADGRTVVADENYLRESIMNSQAKVVQGYQAHHAGVPGHGERREPDAAHRLHQDAEAGEAAAAQGQGQDMNAVHRTTAVTSTRRMARVVAPDQGPQAHRDALPDLDHDLLRGRRHRSRAGIRLELLTPKGDLVSAGHLQQAVHAARRRDDLLLPDPVDSGDARELPHSDHDAARRTSRSRASTC